jgi:hypothetical protein
MIKTLWALLLTVVLSGCDVNIEAVSAQFDQQFGTQNFVSAVSVIELHKLRNGDYPSTLNELEFLGDWDSIWLSGVEYERVEGGYNLFVTKGFSGGEPHLSMPIRFKQGLGLKSTNVQWLDDSSRLTTML